MRTSMITKKFVATTKRTTLQIFDNYFFWLASSSQKVFRMVVVTMVILFSLFWPK